MLLPKSRACAPSSPLRSHKRALLEERRYEKIIHHPNYNPRIVEYMTLARTAERIAPNMFFETFLKNLANPIMIWDHAFRNQLSEAGQHLVLVMGTLGDEVRFSDLEAAFHSFYAYRQKKLGFSSSSRDFDNAVKELDGNFLKTSLIGHDRIVTLHNPSLSDFLESYFVNTPTDLMDLIESATFFDQFINLWRGRRGNRYSAFSGPGADRLLQVLSSKLMCSSCGFFRYKVGKEDAFVGVRVQQMSFEQRMAFFIEVSEAINTAGAKRLREALLGELEAHLRLKHGSKEHLTLLLKKVSALGKDTDRFVPLLEAAKACVLRGLNDSDLEDFEALGKFVDAFPKVIRTEELDQARTCFLNFCGDYDESWADSPDDYRYIADTIGRIAEQLDVDVGARCVDLEGKASQWEEEIRSSEEENGGEDDNEEPWGRSESASDDTSTMFEELLGELNESDS